jgi:hypothetical protein
MKVLVDTNIILDVLLHRIAFFDHSRKIFELVEQNRVGHDSKGAIFTKLILVKSSSDTFLASSYSVSSRTHITVRPVVVRVVPIKSMAV